MANDTVKKDETQEVSKRVTRIEAILRILQAELKQHFNIDVSAKAGKAHVGLIMLVVVMLGGVVAFAGNTTLWSLRPSSAEPTPNCYVISDGTSATLVVDKISAGVTNIVTSTGLTVTGAATVSTTLAVKGATTLTNLTVQTASITLTGLPTTTNGLTSGRLWLNSNVLTIIP